MLNLTEKDNELIDQIWCNMVNRGILSAPEEQCLEFNTDENSMEGIQKSELNILAIHIKRRAYEEISDLILQKSLDIDTFEELKSKLGILKSTNENQISNQGEKK